MAKTSHAIKVLIFEKEDCFMMLCFFGKATNNRMNATKKLSDICLTFFSQAPCQLTTI